MSTVVIGYDGSPAAENALHQAAALLASRKAVVVVVWEAGKAFELLQLPAAGIPAFPAGTVDVRTAMELDKTMYESAQQVAQQGARLAAADGLTAEALTVAEDATVAETLVRVAMDLSAAALVVGHASHGRLEELLLGSTTRDVLKHAPCPVVVVPHT